MAKEHHYKTTVTWTGNNGTGTSGYADYGRDHVLHVAGKTDIACSADTPFRGDASKHNPEDMLLYALSSCHMLWYFHLCADAGVIVTNYTDQATGTMVQTPENGGHFAEVVLHPVVTVSDPSMAEIALELHDAAHRHCFIANSVNFPVRHEPVCIAGE
jgi:organic hydroperoxide reductase OsmC/OhrA